MKDFAITNCERFNFSTPVAKKMSEIDSSKKHPFLGKIGSRAIGPAVIFSTSVITALAHLTLALLKAPVALILLPYNFLAICFFPGKRLPRDLEICSCFSHIFKYVESLFYTVSLPVIMIFDPKKAYMFTRGGMGLSKITLGPTDEEIEEKSKELLALNYQILKNKIEKQNLKNNINTFITIEDIDIHYTPDELDLLNKKKTYSYEDLIK